MMMQGASQVKQQLLEQQLQEQAAMSSVHAAMTSTPSSPECSPTATGKTGQAAAPDTELVNLATPVAQTGMGGKVGSGRTFAAPPPPPPPPPKAGASTPGGFKTPPPPPPPPARMGTMFVTPAPVSAIPRTGAPPPPPPPPPPPSAAGLLLNLSHLHLACSTCYQRA